MNTKPYPTAFWSPLTLFLTERSVFESTNGITSYLVLSLSLFSFQLKEFLKDPSKFAAAAAAPASAAPTGAAAKPAAKEEPKKKEPESDSDDDMGGLDIFG